MRLVKLISFLFIAVLFSGISMAVTEAAVTVDGPYTDTITGGDWTQKYATGGSCFYLLPTPPRVEWTEFNIETFTPSPLCSGGSLAMSGNLEWDLFAMPDNPIYTWYFNPAGLTQSRPENGSHPGDQWNPCISDFLGATFDNGDYDNGVYEPLVSEVTVNYTGSFRIAYYFLEELLVCRDLKYDLWVNGIKLKSGTIADFDSGKYVVFNINGLTGTSTIRLEVTNPYADVVPARLSPNCSADQIAGTNVHLSGIFIDKCSGFQGCTPGYWKQSQHFGSWIGYYPVSNGSAATKFCSVFTCPSGFSIKWSAKGPPSAVTNPTLLQALEANGGDIDALARHATAALLNASNPNVAYPRSASEIVSMVNAALAGGDIEGTANILAGWNESYWNGMHNCPLSK